VELLERVGVLDRDLRGERASLHVPALLQLEQVPAVAEDGSLREALRIPFAIRALPREVTQCSDRGGLRSEGRVP